MSASLTPQQISKALFQTDPMSTCCKENDCVDEYDYVADTLAEKLGEGFNLNQALTTAISEWFLDGENYDANRLTPALELLREESP
jgi:hypothetical protein